jgi:hypothetical protein
MGLAHRHNESAEGFVPSVRFRFFFCFFFPIATSILYLCSGLFLVDMDLNINLDKLQVLFSFHLADVFTCSGFWHCWFERSVVRLSWG